MKRIITKEQLAEILSKHKKWIMNEDGGERADLRNADLRYADLRYADLRYADLRNAESNEGTGFLALACPEEGAFIGWKTAHGLIIKLKITEDAKRSSATTRKCRCSKAEVLEIQTVDGEKTDVKSVPSDRSDSFLYTVGETVEVPDFDENRWNECSSGIHFFITRAEAVNYGK